MHMVESSLAVSPRRLAMRVGDFVYAVPVETEAVERVDGPSELRAIELVRHATDV